MLAWIQDIAGPTYAPAVMWTALALVLLVVLLVLIRLVRSLTSGTYVAGGRNRRTRLSVMDAAAIDSHRRLVLVRRDDVEHLVLIGGPTDIVVEQNIRLNAPARRPADEPQTEHHETPAPAAERLAPPPPRVDPRAQRPAEPRLPLRSQTTPSLATPTAPPLSAMPPRTSASIPPVRPAQTVAPAASRYQSPLERRAEPRIETRPADLDARLRRDLESKPEPARPAAEEFSLEDEMNKLLGDLSAQKR